ncbi:conserved hypothetical protein [Methanosalsum zhilinae DSM 4017]|uniref:Uncharacterized protein n=1 Tax=Methanosalsum zhilinae (strain DSM 4017 / NBRC 107636 / OCM 62 / WeN5) TaxID=679901 RepID=F7XQC9_METZD|nr:hypothetical protein [Methanosalsum zhilinae]AEH61595.1 conserved hypothetical protein [Methanosalsum zhilinae DSM 4017]
MNSYICELIPEDFEYADPPLSLDYVVKVFKKYDLEFIAHFGEERFYVSHTPGEPMIPAPGGIYPLEIEQIFSYMVMERINVIRCRDGKMYRETLGEMPSRLDM